MVTTSPRVAPPCALLHGAMAVVLQDGLEMEPEDLMQAVRGERDTAHPNGLLLPKATHRATRPSIGPF